MASESFISHIYVLNDLYYELSSGSSYSHTRPMLSQTHDQGRFLAKGILISALFIVLPSHILMPIPGQFWFCCSESSQLMDCHRTVSMDRQHHDSIYQWIENDGQGFVVNSIPPKKRQVDEWSFRCARMQRILHTDSLSPHLLQFPSNIRVKRKVGWVLLQVEMLSKSKYQHLTQ